MSHDGPFQGPRKGYHPEVAHAIPPVTIHAERNHPKMPRMAKYHGFFVRTPAMMILPAKQPVNPSGIVTRHSVRKKRARWERLLSLGDDRPKCHAKNEFHETVKIIYI